MRGRKDFCEDKTDQKEKADTVMRRMWKSGHNLRERVLGDAGPKKTLTKQKVFAGELGPGHTLERLEPFYFG